MKLTTRIPRSKVRSQRGRYVKQIVADNETFCIIFSVRSKISQKIVDVINQAGRPLFPREIALFAKVNKNTVRSYCRRLLKKGLLKQPAPGLYTSTVANTNYGEGGGDSIKTLRLQNLMVQVKHPISENIHDFNGQFGTVGIKIQFGRKRQRITGYLSCPEGMNFNTFVLALEKFKHVVASRLGFFPEDNIIIIKRAEFLEDFQKVRMNLIKCLTVESFLGSFEKIYNRKNGLRSEVRCKPDSVEAILTLLKGGVKNYNLLKLLFSTLNQLRELMAIIECQCKGTQHLHRMLFHLTETLRKIAEHLQNCQNQKIHNGRQKE